ncbi:MAG TPA: hypothetical protein PKG60_16140 [Spirochaetota bacterium]|nr:hypothetical protein [Spirochaetota bacterium]HPS88115.1 hypothetical protein [Spirochaetota bacterium]
MRLNFKINFILISLILSFIILPVNTFASDEYSRSLLINNIDFNNSGSGSIYLAAIESSDENKPAGKISDKNNDSQINYHKILGWTTLGMMTVTIASGFIIPDKGHCALAGVTTGFAVATCADGIYEYGGLISFTDGDWKYNTHAILGVLATAGFITTLALADGDGHVATGIASGSAFSIALGVLYF